jgi:quercetin dioxygenase-like cupin family protein
MREDNTMSGSSYAGAIPTTQQETLLDGPLGAVELLPARATDGQLSVVMHPLAPRTLGSPVHTHRGEDEYSIITEGTIGVQIGDKTSLAHVGDVLCKPRGVPHAFWNPGDEPARLLEIITPGGFTGYFRELGEIFAAEAGPDPERFGALAARYGLEVDFSSIESLSRQHGLRADT